MIPVKLPRPQTHRGQHFHLYKKELSSLQLTNSPLPTIKIPFHFGDFIPSNTELQKKKKYLSITKGYIHVIARVSVDHQRKPEIKENLTEKLYY